LIYLQSVKYKAGRSVFQPGRPSKTKELTRFAGKRADFTAGSVYYDNHYGGG